jgi:hypothetical protein
VHALAVLAPAGHFRHHIFADDVLHAAQTHIRAGGLSSFSASQ